MRRVDLEIDGLTVDALVVARYPSSLVLNLAPHFTKVEELPPRNVQELGPFILACDACGGVRDVDLVALGLLAVTGDVDELEDERAASDDAAATGKEISANNVLEDRRLAGGLRADYDLCWGLADGGGPEGEDSQSAASPGNHCRWC